VIAPLIFRRVLPSHLFFYLGGSFFLCRRKIYIALTWVSIATALSLRNRYGGDAEGCVQGCTGCACFFENHPVNIQGSNPVFRQVPS
jgi:hypothetical protein